MAPEHKNPTRKNRTAVAPYNFVPLAIPVLAFADNANNPLAVDHSRYHNGRWTGWIDVTLTTKSPLYIRGALTPAEYAQMEAEEKGGGKNKLHLDKIRNRPDFFFVDPKTKEPVIPGSSLRGMIRSVAEILGHGKLKPVMNTPLIYRAVGDTSSHGEAYRKMLMKDHPDSNKRHHYEPLFEAGYIRHDAKTGKWFIQPAKKTADGASYGRIHHKRIPRHLQKWHKSKNASEIYVEFGPRQYQKIRGGFLHVKFAKIVDASQQADRTNLQKAVLVRSGRMFSKKTEAVFMPPDEQADYIPIPDVDSDESQDLITAYRDQISPEQEQLLGKNGVLVDCQPVFYLMKKDKLLFFFGHTQMFRMPYPRSPQQLLSPPHRDNGRIDFIEAMFGTAKDNQASGLAGRIFVSDASLHQSQDKNALWLENDQVVIPKVLSSPKPTTFQHYLTQSKPDVDKGKGLHTYNSRPGQTTLRGHKLYWHKPQNLKRSDYAESPKNVDRRKDKIHTQIKPVRAGVKFTFRIHFENLIPVELGLLWWTLALPVNDKQTYCHKLGMGKPLGLGAIQLEPALRLVDTQTRYATLFDDKTTPSAWAAGEVDSFVAAAKREAVQNFETFVLKRTKAPVKQFADIKRVKMLLAMLAWPGPDKDHTRYMEIERPDAKAKRGKRNEYKERPVLPDPLQVKREHR